MGKIGEDFGVELDESQVGHQMPTEKDSEQGDRSTEDETLDNPPFQKRENSASLRRCLKDSSVHLVMEVDPRVRRETRCNFGKKTLIHRSLSSCYNSVTRQEAELHQPAQLLRSATCEQAVQIDVAEECCNCIEDPFQPLLFQIYRSVRARLPTITRHDGAVSVGDQIRRLGK